MIGIVYFRKRGQSDFMYQYTAHVAAGGVWEERDRFSCEMEGKKKENKKEVEGDIIE